MSVNSCFASVIGLARNQDLCVSGWDAGFAVSDSGLFLADLQGLSLKILDSAKDGKTLWTMMDNARMNGINKFKADIQTEIMKYNQYRRQNFTGDIGYRRFTQSITKDTYHGLRMYSNIRGGVFVLREVTLNLNSTEAVNLAIYDDFELLYTVALTSEANKPKKTTLATPIELDLNGNYYFIYAPVGTPQNNKMTCGCGGYHWCFNIEHPCFKQTKENWTEWCMAGGIHGTDVSLRDDWGVSEYAQGLRLHGEFKCDAMGMLCSDASDFENNEIDYLMAWAILYKAGEFLTYEIMNSGDVNRYTLIGKNDIMAANIAYYGEHYNQIIAYVGSQIEPSRNECLKCRPVLGISKSSHQL